jgi:hypothetical protein
MSADKSPSQVGVTCRAPGALSVRPQLPYREPAAGRYAVAGRFASEACASDKWPRLDRANFRARPGNVPLRMCLHAVDVQERGTLNHHVPGTFFAA